MIKRKAVLAAASFMTGISAFWWGLNFFTALFVSFFLFLLGVFFARKNIGIIILLIIFFLGGMLRCSFKEKEWEKTVFDYGGRTLIKEMVITDFSNTDKAYAYIYDEGKKVKIYVSFDKEKLLYPGDIVRAKIKTYGVSKSKVEKFGFVTSLASKEIFLRAKAEDARITGVENRGITGKIFSLRRYINEIGEKSFKGDVRALFNAMVLGDKSLITPKLNKYLQGSGLNHIAVVSGMHISIIISFMMFFMRRLFGKRRIGNILAVAGAIFITLLMGNGFSAQRACIMCILFQIAGLFYRENDSLTSLFVALFIMAAVNPFVIFSASLMLSALSVLGILIYNKKLKSAFNYIFPKEAASVFALSLSAYLGVCPLVIYYFGIITPYSLIANLFVFPFATAIVPLGMVYALLYNIGFIRDVLSFFVELTAKGIIEISGAISSLPYAITEIGALSLPLFVMWLLFLIVLYLYPERMEKAQFLTSSLALLLCIFIAIDSLGTKSMNFHFFNYAMRKSIIALSSEGNAMIIDCADSYDVMTFMENKAIEKFEYAILTGTDYEEMLLLAKNGVLQNLFVPLDCYKREETEKITEDFKDTTVNIEFLSIGESFLFDGALIDYIKTGEESNGKAAVRIEYGKESFVSLQSFSSPEIEKLIKEKEKIDCDMLLLPFTVFHRETDKERLTDGKIIEKEKNISLKIF